MHFSQRIKGYRLPVNATGAVWKGAQPVLLLCGLLGVVSVLLASGGTMAGPDAGATDSDRPSGRQAGGKAPPGMVWIPRGTFLMGTNDKESFPNERPAHLV